MWDWVEQAWPASCAGCGVPAAGRVCRRCAPLALAPVPAPLFVDRAYAQAAYHAPLGAIVRHAKAGHDRGLGVAIALRFASAAAHTEDLSFDAVVAAPSPWTRRLWRGFSLASLLSHQVARQLCIPDLPSLSRAAGPRQSKLSRAERTRNAAQGIRARAPVPPRVLLVDDVLTTGATASGCARALRAAGANEVWLATVCIAVRTQEPSGEVPAF